MYSSHFCEECGRPLDDVELEAGLCGRCYDKYQGDRYPRHPDDHARSRYDKDY